MFTYDSFIRFFDIVIATFVFVILLPFFLIIALIILMDSPGHFLYWQERVGMNGKTFMILKFRTMKTCREETAPQFRRDSNGQVEPVLKVRHDKRTTHIGSFLRKYSIDELPQLFNIIKGEMSLVGPRPTIMEEVREYKAHQKERLTGKPGLTGLAQINGRTDMNFEDIVKYDVYYIKNRSLWLYLKVLFLTFPAVFSGKSSY